MICKKLYNFGGDQYLLFYLSQISSLPKGWTIYIHTYFVRFPYLTMMVS